MAGCPHQAHLQNARSSGIISCTAETARSLRRKLLIVHRHTTLSRICKRRFKGNYYRCLIVHRHTTLYRILGLTFLCSTLLLMALSAVPAWPSATRVALFLLSFFPLILSLSYFYLGNQEERGY